MANVEISFTIDGIGPHYDVNKIPKKIFSKSSINTAIFAENGRGKTFISRCFALNENISNLTTDDTNNLLSLGKDSGEFTFSVKTGGNMIHEYSINLKRGKTPEVKNTGVKQYIYHVFNNDYVERNIAERNYSPNGDITGYIIGQTNIDVSNEKNTLKIKEQSCDFLKGKIMSAIESVVSELKHKGIKGNLSELKNINYEGVISKEHLEQDESYEMLLEQYNRLKSVPDDIPVLTLDFPSIDNYALIEADRILTTKYDRAHFDDQVMGIIEKVRANKSFFETGLVLYKNQNEKCCPFCHSEIDNKAMYYLDLYRTYFSQAEAQIINEIDKIISSIEILKKDIKKIDDNFNELVINFEKYKGYLPEFSNIDSSNMVSSKEIINNLMNILNYLNSKKENINNANFDISNILEDFDDYVSQAKLIYDEQLAKVTKLQRSLSDTNSSRLKLSRKICNARYNKLIDECSKYVNDLNKVNVEIIHLKYSISLKEGQARIEKKEIVKNDLKKLLDYFFHDKYTLDDETFGITFMHQNLNERAKNILSDGEKSILAFCYFLATTHTLINSEADYDNLFFIFDDPISSMDFKYVYVVADILRGLKNYFPKIKDKARYIVLTHNSEFMSIMCRNKIVAIKLYLKPGQIEKLKDELILPYEHHLYDIVQIAHNMQSPDHTTPNSIRQVVETIMHFEIPREPSTEKYVREDEILNKNAYIYSLMQDGSHGALIKQPPITDDDLIEACRVVEKFVKNKYPRQIEVH